jgi:hypothetical protein
MAEELIELGRACRKGEIRRQGYVTKKGVRVPPACVQDQGAPGKTAESKKWFPEGVEVPGWSKSKTIAQRRAALKKLAGKKPCKRILSDMNAIANVTADRATKTKMRADRRWLKKQGVCKL